MFCAGHDLKELRADPSPEFYNKVFSLAGRLMLTIADFPRPVIAEVKGIATAAGCQLVATADLAIAADDARFATPGVNIGLFCSTPMVALSRAVAPKHAMQMLLTGEMIDAEEAVPHRPHQQGRAGRRADARRPWRSRARSRPSRSRP